MVKCEVCGKQIDPADKTNWHKVTGWRRNSGSSSVLFVEGPWGHACSNCMVDKKFGVKPEKLF